MSLANGICAAANVTANDIVETDAHKTAALATFGSANDGNMRTTPLMAITWNKYTPNVKDDSFASNPPRRLSIDCGNRANVPVSTETDPDNE